MDEADQHDIEESLRKQIAAYHATALAYACIKLRLPETMGTEAWTADRLAAALGLSASHLLRSLQGLETVGLVKVEADGRFALTPLGHTLTPGSPSALREKLLIVVEQYWQPWANLAACIEAGTPSFETVFGMPVAGWRRHHAEHGTAFDSYLARESYARATPILEVLDLQGAQTLADIGGGYGGLLAAILQANPGLRAILFDQAHTLDAAKPYLEAHGVADRVSFVAGDFFEDVPVEADIYLLKSVLQQHGDAQAQTILETCRKAMAPGATLIVIERLMPDAPGDDPAAVMLDLHMMTITGGKLRTKPEMEALMAAGGLTVDKLSRASDGLALIEATSP